jgi:SAM-dependent methyltransferase
MTEFNRKQHWEQVYTDKSPLEVSWYQKEPAISLQLIENSGIDKAASIIDVGGGASLLVDYLQQRGFSKLAVLDISAHALEHAKSRLGERAGEVEWYESDVTTFAAPHPYQLWHDRAVFHFLTEARDRRNYVEVLKQTVPVDGHLIIAAFAIGGPEKCSGLDIVQYDAAKLGAELGEEFALQEQVEELHETPASKQQAFNYFRFFRR